MTAGSNPVRIAIIGISGYGRIHLELARECHDRGEAVLVAAVVINPEEEAENVAELRSRNCAIYADFKEMFARHAGEIDLCLIPTGIPWHAHMTIAALNAGANVLVEKPIASSLREVAEISAAELKNNRTVAVGFQDCYDPATLWLVDALRQLAIGQVRSVRFLGIWPRSRAYFERNNWAGRLIVDGAPVLDSPLNNAFAHFVMLSLLFAGGELTVGGIELEQAELFRAHHIESFDTGVVTFKTRDGVRLWFGSSVASAETLEPEIIIEGTAGTAFWRYENEAVIAHANGQVERQAIPDQRSTRREMMVAVLKRVRNARAAVCTTAMASRHTEVIEMIHRRAIIKSFHPDLITWTTPTDADEALPRVLHLDSSLRLAFAAQKSLRETGFDSSESSVNSIK